jgi:CheY-like chemotaxis protein
MTIIQNATTASGHLNAEINPCKLMSKKRALIVEDDLFSRKLFSKILSDNIEDVEVVFAKNYQEAVKLLQNSNNFSIIILDINLGGNKTGIDIYNNISAAEQNPIVIMTSTLEQQEFKDLFQKGLSIPAYLKKPFSPKLCINLVEALIEERIV